MEVWVLITIAAAFLQNVRLALQKHLTGHLSTTGATFVLFGYGFTVAVAYVIFCTTEQRLYGPRCACGSQVSPWAEVFNKFLRPSYWCICSV